MECSAGGTRQALVSSTFPALEPEESRAVTLLNKASAGSPLSLNFFSSSKH